jgi:hypothetical protein
MTRTQDRMTISLGGTRAAGRGASFAAAVYLLSRAATLSVAAGITLISGSSLGGVLSRWDGGWYLSIVRDGYPSYVPSGTGTAAQSSLAFFPGYPLLVRALSAPFDLSPVLVGCAVSLAAGLAATVGLWHLADRLSDASTADRAVVLFAFLPSAFVMTMVYADALFLALAVWCLLALLDRRWMVAGMVAAAAGFVRPTGIALVIACAWAAAVAIREERSWRPVVAPAVAPWGALAFLVYTGIHTGDALAFFHVESRGWNNHLDVGAANVRAVIRHLSEMRPTFFVVVLAVIVGGIGLGLWLLVRWRAPGFVVAYATTVLAVSILGSNPVSTPRLLLAAFPILIPLAELLSPRATMTVAAASGTLMGTLFFVTGLSPHLPP